MKGRNEGGGPHSEDPPPSYLLKTGSAIPVVVPPPLLEVLLVQAQRDERPVADMYPLLTDRRQVLGYVPRCRSYPFGPTATLP